MTQDAMLKSVRGCRGAAAKEAAGGGYPSCPAPARFNET